MRSISILLALALALPALSQPTLCHAEFNTFNFDTNISMGGPNLMLAIKTTAPSNYVATRVEIYTGESVGQNTIALWSHDAANNRPSAMLGSGAWSMSRINSWQGAILSTPVTVTQGQILWVVWSPINASQASAEGPTGSTQQYRATFNGGQSWLGPFQDTRWKFRISCGGPVGHYESFGAGCVGSARTRPELGWFGLPAVGANFIVHLYNALPSSIAVLTIGDSDTTWLGSPLPLSLASLGAPNCNALCSVVASIVVGIDVTGETNVTLPFPPTPSIAGWRFFDQWWVLDPNANAFGFALSNGGRGIVSR